MQINVPPGARILIETHDAPIAVAAPVQRRRVGIGIAIAVIAFAAGIAADHLPARAPAQPAAAVTLPEPHQPKSGPMFQPIQPPSAQANPFGLKP